MQVVLTLRVISEGNSGLFLIYFSLSLAESDGPLAGLYTGDWQGT
jgi:hypothetical protein